MTTSEFKRVGRLLKELYAELEKEAFEEGVDIFSEEFIQVRDALRTEVLTRLGFTVEEYREAKELVAPAKKVDVQGQLGELSTKTLELEDRLRDLDIPDEDEILEKAKELAESVVKPPVIQNNIVERTTIEKPTIVEKTIIETEEYDDAPIYAELGYLHDKLESIKMPEIPDVDEKIEAVKTELKNDFMRELEHNIDTLGMPDFRKLAMGLQAQIDELKNTPAATSTGTRTTVVTSGNTNAGTGGDFVYIVSGNHTVTLPTAVGNTGMYTIKNNHSANITVDSLGGTIDGTATISLAPEESVTLFSDDTNWNIV